MEEVRRKETERGGDKKGKLRLACGEGSELKFSMNGRVIVYVDLPGLGCPPSDCLNDIFREADGGVKSGANSSRRMASEGSIQKGEELGVEPRSSGKGAISTDKKSWFGTMEGITSYNVGTK
jgi:hypothetical protein